MPHPRSLLIRKAVIPTAKQNLPKGTADVIAGRIESIRFRKDLFRLIVRILLIGCVAYLLFTQVILVTRVSGQDMFPALKDGDLVIAFRMQKDYQKGDIVVCRTGTRQTIERIAANPHDVVNMDDSGILTVNGTTQTGEIIYPTYAKESLTYPYRVPEDSVFLLGDYRTVSVDSRDFGPVSKEQFLGKVITILRRREL